MRQQYHFKEKSGEVLIWDVNKLITASENLPIIEIDLKEIKELNENYWFRSTDNIPTCKSIADHSKLIIETDLKYPIILASDGSIMDGMHRVCKAYIPGLKKIKAKKFENTPDRDYINKHPNELPY